MRNVVSISSGFQTNLQNSTEVHKLQGDGIVGHCFGIGHHVVHVLQILAVGLIHLLIHLCLRNSHIKLSAIPIPKHLCLTFRQLFRIYGKPFVFTCTWIIVGAYLLTEKPYTTLVSMNGTNTIIEQNLVTILPLNITVLQK